MSEGAACEIWGRIYGFEITAKVAYSFTIILMAVGTALIGLAPTYERAGIGSLIVAHRWNSGIAYAIPCVFAVLSDLISDFVFS